LQVKRTYVSTIVQPPRQSFFLLGRQGVSKIVDMGLARAHCRSVNRSKQNGAGFRYSISTYVS
jgi:hypothetical protein